MSDNIPKRKIVSCKAEKRPHGFKLLQTLQGHSDIIHRIAWSPDGQLIASPSRDKTVRIWDVKTGTVIKTLRGHSHEASSVAWSPNGQYVASGSHDSTIRIWNVGSGSLLQILKGHTNFVYTVAWSRDGKSIASSSADSTIILWNTRAWEKCGILKGHIGLVKHVTWSPEGQRLASCSDISSSSDCGDNTVCLWHVDTCELLKTLDRRAFGIWTVEWSPNGRWIVSCGKYSTIDLWDGETGRPISVLKGHTDWIKHVHFSFDNLLLASKSYDGTVRVWRCDTWETVAILDEKGGDPNSTSISFHPKEPILATLADGSTEIRIWRIDYEELLGGTPINLEYEPNKIGIKKEPRHMESLQSQDGRYTESDKKPMACHIKPLDSRPSDQVDKNKLIAALKVLIGRMDTRRKGICRRLTLNFFLNPSLSNSLYEMTEAWIEASTLEDLTNTFMREDFPSTDMMDSQYVDRLIDNIDKNVIHTAAALAKLARDGTISGSPKDGHDFFKQFNLI